MPREFMAAVEYAINTLLRRAVSGDDLDADRIQNLLSEAQASNVMLDRTTLEFSLRKKLELLAVRFATNPSKVERLNELRSGLKIVSQMPFIVNLWVPQNHVFALQGGLYQRMRRKAQKGDSNAQAWVDGYLELCELLSIRVN